MPSILILHIDRELCKDFTDILKTEIENLTAYQIHMYEEPFELKKEWPIDLVILLSLFLNSPTPGDEILRQIKATYPCAKRVINSSYLSVEDLAQSRNYYEREPAKRILEAGFDAFVSKFRDVDELISAVRQLLGLSNKSST